MMKGNSRCSERTRRLRERMLNAEHNRHRILLPSDWSTGGADASIAERKALALKLMLERMPIFIEPEELIVGGRTVFSPGTGDGPSLPENPRNVSNGAFPRYLTDDERAGPGMPEGHSVGHYVPYYPKVMTLGFGGIVDEARTRLPNEPDEDKQAFLSSVCIAYEGAGALANRYANLAAQMARAETDPLRSHELLGIAAVCRHVAARPPETLHHACQLTFLTHLVTLIENRALISLGRMDQYLLPFYRACEPDHARELLQALLIKLNDIADVQPGGAMISYDGMDNLMLGGFAPDGSDATNELTYAILDTLDAVRLPNPEVGARIHAGSPEPYVRRACELICSGMGQVALYNDDAFVPALVSAGFPVEDARDYVLDACQDVNIDGKNCSVAAGASVSMTEVLLNTLESVADATNFEAFLATYKKNIARHVADALENARDKQHCQIEYGKSPVPFMSGTMHDCIEGGRDLTRGGLRYGHRGMFMLTPVTAANSLAAIKHCVFDRNDATLDELRSALAADFEGFEPLRRKLLAAPKWGNDDDAVDLLGKEVLEFGSREVFKHRTLSGDPFLPGIHQPHTFAVGSRLRATPDGRRQGEPVPVTLSPANGTDRNGPTAAMCSAAKIDPKMTPWNYALSLNFNPETLTGPEAVGRFMQLFRAFFAMGGMELQCNVVGVETLREAQERPDQYRDLVVRVWGFSGRFTELAKGYQDDLIARTSHSL